MPGEAAYKAPRVPQPAGRRDSMAAGGARSAVPTIGYLGSETPELFADRLAAFRQGLAAGRTGGEAGDRNDSDCLRGRQ
jgi:hypothetical protein